MKFSLATIASQGRPTAAIEVAGKYWSLSEAAPELMRKNPARGLLNMFDEWQRSEPVLAQLAQHLATGGANASPIASEPENACFLTPLQYPSKVVCVGANYYDHVHNDAGWTSFRKESSLLPMFLKAPTTSLVGPGRTVRYPAHTKKLDWEIELALVIGRSARKVPEAEALDLIAGYTIGIDLSARDWQFHPKHVSKMDLFGGKSFDDSCPLGPRIVPARFLDGNNLPLRLSVNGELKQNSNTREMIWSLAEQLSYVSTHLTLEPGDVILTGTPAGVGLRTGTFLKVGDKVDAQIEGIGVLSIEIIEDLDVIHSSYAEHSFD